MEFFPVLGKSACANSPSLKRKVSIFNLKAWLTTIILIALGFCFSADTFGQTKTISIRGIVLDEELGPLPGVNISSGNNLVSSNDKGAFLIKVASLPVQVKFSHIGFINQDVLVKEAGLALNVILKQDNQLNEVVVVGYGETTKAKNTGTISKVKGEDLARQPVTNPLLAMQGRVPGVVISSSSGNLGSAVSVQIRGTNSLRGNSYSNPLYLIDGVPMPSQSINSSAIGGAAGGQSPFTYINPSEIESIEILKDADATAIYGSRGANGVVLITTKRPQSGKLKISADFYRGYQQVVNKLDVLGTQEFIQMRKDAFAADGTTPTAALAPDLFEWGTGQTDWQKETMGKSAALSNAQLDLQGGDQLTQFIVSIGYRDENGILMGKNNSKRGTARLNLNHRSLDQRFSFATRFSYSSSLMDARSNSSSLAALLAPNLPQYDGDGNPYFFGTSTAFNTSSPMKYLFERTVFNSYNFIGGGTAAYQFFKNLNFKVDANFTRMDIRGTESNYDKSMNQNANLTYSNQTAFGTNYQNTYNVEPQLNYKAKIADGSLSFLLGSTFQQTLAGGGLIYGRDFPSELLMDNLYSAGSVIKASNSTTFTKYRYTSVFARLGYDFKDRYLVNITYRRDGSTRFGEDKRFGNFGAVAVAWLFGNEKFVRDNVKFLSSGKLRASYGLTGNDQIADYVYLNTFSSTINYNGKPGIIADQLGNSEFSWETTKKFEAALELGFLKSKLLFNVSFYRNISDNQLVNIPVASQTGWSTYVGNLDAKSENKGLELDLTSRNIEGKNFKWGTTFNISWATNKLLEYPGLQNSTYSNTYMIGKSINAYRRYEFLGIDPSNGSPLIKNQDGLNSINSTDDYIYAGTPDYKYYGGIGNNLTYKGIELDFFFQFVKRPTVNSFIRSTNTSPMGGLYNVSRERLEKVWKKPGDVTELPRLSAATSGSFYSLYANQYAYSTAAITDGSFIRLKNVSLSYSLPKSWISGAKLNSVRVYMQAQNIFTLTNYDGYDPETLGNIPPLKTWTFGASITL